MGNDLNRFLKSEPNQEIQFFLVSDKAKPSVSVSWGPSVTTQLLNKKGNTDI